MAAITEAMVKQFGSNVEFLVQQKGSRLRGAVRVETGIVGEDVFFEQLAETAAVKKTTRNADTPLVKSDHRRRRVSMFDLEWADLVDKQDKLKLRASKQSKLSRSTRDNLLLLENKNANGNLQLLRNRRGFRRNRDSKQKPKRMHFRLCK